MPVNTPPVSPVTPDGKQPEITAAETSTIEQIKKYRSALESSGKILEKKFHKQAKRMTQYYELAHYLNAETGEELETNTDRIQVNTPYANTRQILAEVYLKNPTAIVKPKKKSHKLDAEKDEQGVELSGAQEIDTLEGAKKLKSCIDYVIRESNFKRSSKRAILEGIPVGLGTLMITTMPGSKVPKFERILARDLIYSHEVLDIYDSPWIGRRIVKPLDEIKADKRFNDNRLKVSPAKSTIKGSTTQYGVLWDIWNKQDDRHMLLPDGQDLDLYNNKSITEDYNFKQETDEFPADWPFIFYVNEEQITQAYGLGDIAPIEPQVQEKNRIRTYQVNHIKRYNRKYLTKKRFLDDQGIYDLTHGEDGTVVEVKEDISPAVFQTVQDAPMPADVYRVEDSIDRDIDIVQATGSTGVFKGVGQTPGTLGEAQIIESNSATRKGDKQDTVEQFYSRAIRLIAQFIQQHWVESDVILVTGDGSKPTDWLDYNNKEIQGEYGYGADPESSKDNSALYRKQSQEALNTLVPLLTPNPQGMTLIQIPGIALMARKYLETFETFARDIDSIVPEPSDQPPAPLEEGGENDPDKELEELVNSSDPDELIDKLKGLPDNEREALTGRIQAIQQRLAPTNPSNSQLTSSVTRLNV